MRRKQKIDPEFSVKAGEQMISDTGQHICMAEGCFDIGSHPAPKNRQELRSYIWFCLDHIRMFNSQWNYYDGLEGTRWSAKSEGPQPGNGQAGNLAQARLQNWPVLIRLRINFLSLTRLTPRHMPRPRT